MRIYIKTTPNKEIVPFNYQQKLVGTFHKWLGWNELHDDLSLYSLSWLSPGNSRNRKGLDFPEGTTFFISAPGSNLAKQVIEGLYQDGELFCGMRVKEVILRNPPEFSNRAYFYVQSPILIKRRIEDRTKFYFPKDEESDYLMSETLRHKMRVGGLEDLDLKLRFDHDYAKGKTKVTTYRGIENKGSLHPVIAEGDPRALAFCWETGLGNCTGIGFGAIK